MLHEDEHNEKQRLPFSRTYWVVEGVLMAGIYPGAPEEEEEHRKLSALLDCGIVTVINLMEEDELGLFGEEIRKYEPKLRQLARERRLRPGLQRFPVRDMSVPDIDTMKRILNRIDREIDAGRTVYVHCLGGVGRTGTVIGCWLARHGIAVGDAALECINMLRKFDPMFALPSPQTLEQCSMVREWPAGQ
jgi:protein-tyrosine phosphatase